MNNKLYYADFHFMDIVAVDLEEVRKWLENLYYRCSGVTVKVEDYTGAAILEMSFEGEIEGTTDNVLFSVKRSPDTSVKNLWLIENYENAEANKRVKLALARQKRINKNVFKHEF